MKNIDDELDALETYLQQQSDAFYGYQVNIRYDYDKLFKFFRYGINNVGDPFVESTYKISTRVLEPEVIRYFGGLFKMPSDDTWGYVTHGGTEGNLYGMLMGRELYPDAIVYTSEDAHYSIAKNAMILGMKMVTVKSQANGEVDYPDLCNKLLTHKDKPAVLVLNIGTTMKGAIDNVDEVIDILMSNDINNYYIHCDAALQGMIVPLTDESNAANFTRPIGSISISGHKFIGCPMPCGIVLARKKNVQGFSKTIEYLGVHDTTIPGSRNGHSVLFLWYAIRTRGDNFKQEADYCIENARYLHRQLLKLGVTSLLNKHSIAVYFDKPSDYICSKYHLAIQGNKVHIFTMQHIDRAKIGIFLEDLAADIETTRMINDRDSNVKESTLAK